MDTGELQCQGEHHGGGEGRRKQQGGPLRPETLIEVPRCRRQGTLQIVIFAWGLSRPGWSLGLYRFIFRLEWLVSLLAMGPPFISHPKGTDVCLLPVCLASMVLTPPLTPASSDHCR